MAAGKLKGSGSGIEGEIGAGIENFICDRAPNPRELSQRTTSQTCRGSSLALRAPGAQTRLARVCSDQSCRAKMPVFQTVVVVPHTTQVEAVAVAATVAPLLSVAENLMGE